MHILVTEVMEVVVVLVEVVVVETVVEVVEVVRVVDNVAVFFTKMNQENAKTSINHILVVASVLFMSI